MSYENNNKKLYSISESSPLIDLLLNTDKIHNLSSFLNIINIIGGKLTKKELNATYITEIGNSFEIKKPFHAIYEKLKASQESELVNKVFDNLYKLGMDLGPDYISIDMGNVEEENFDDFFNQDFTSINDFIEKTSLIKNAKRYTQNDVFDRAINFNLFFLKQYIKDRGIEETRDKIKKHGLLHAAIKNNNFEIIDFICVDLDMSINIKNRKGKPAISYCKNDETLKYLLKYKPNLLQPDSKDKDFLFYVNSDQFIEKETAKKMNAIASIYIKENPDLNKTNLYKNEDERIQQTFINMVELDKTKSELLNFLKNNKVKNYKSLENKEGENLAFISLKKQNWTRFDLFYDKDINVNFKNKEGQSYLEYLVHNVSKGIQREKEFNIVVNNLIKDNDNLEDVFSKYINKYDFNKNSFALSFWLTRSKTVIGKVIENGFIDADKEIKFMNTNKTVRWYNFSNENEIINSVSIAFAFAFVFIKESIADLKINIDFEHLFADDNSETSGLINLLALKKYIAEFSMPSKISDFVNEVIQNATSDLGEKTIDFLNKKINNNVLPFWTKRCLELLIDDNHVSLQNLRKDFNVSVIDDSEMEKKLNYFILKNNLDIMNKEKSQKNKI